MPVGRRLPLAAASGAVGAACAIAPALPWLTATGRAGHCGWTCYRPLAATNVAAIDGRGGLQLAPVLSGLLIVLAVLCLVLLVLALRSAASPVALGWTIAGLGFAALVLTVAVIVRYAEGGSLVRTDADGVFSANVGVGAIVGLAGASAVTLLGGAIALGAGWVGAAAGAAVSTPARTTAADARTDGPGTEGARVDRPADGPLTRSGDRARGSRA
jgi:hypothetical protein